MNKIALITGGTRGIGKQIALTFAKEGYNIALNYRTENEDLKNTKKEIEANNVKCFAVQGDVTNFKDCEQFVKQIVEEFGNIDVLVNNAGITRDTLLMRMKEEDFKQLHKLIMQVHKIHVEERRDMYKNVDPLNFEEFKNELLDTNNNFFIHS